MDKHLFKLEMWRLDFDESGVGNMFYFILLYEDRKIWESPSVNWDTFYIHEGRKEMISELVEIGRVYDLIFDTDSDDPEDWCLAEIQDGE